MVPDKYCCKTPGDRVILTGNRGVISNLVTQSSGCGGTECPWLLEGSLGQMFNISLLDFNTYNMVSVSQQFLCDTLYLNILMISDKWNLYARI